METLKTMKKLIILAVVLLGSAATSFAQLTATANITANIQSPTSIIKVLDLNFGNVYTPIASGTTAAVAGTVYVAPKEGPNRIATQGLMLGTGSGQAAKFTISGTPLTSITMNIPSTDPLTLFSGIDFMNVSVDYSNLSPSLVAGDIVTIPLSDSGLFTFWIGGTLHVAPNQAWGSYSNTTDLEFIINQ
jgi:hypothetical protein